MGVGEDSPAGGANEQGGCRGCLKVLCALCADQRHSGEGAACLCPVLALSRSALLHGEGTPFLVLIGLEKGA